MLVCKIQMWPQGVAEKFYPLGEVRITRMSGDRHISHYAAQLMKSEEYAQREGPWRRGQVLNFHRQTLGPYDLLLRGLIACIGGRSTAAVRAVPDGLLFSPPSTERDVA